MHEEMTKRYKGIVLRRVFSWINRIRLILVNLIFILLILGLLFLLFPRRDRSGEKSSILLINPTGSLVIRSNQPPIYSSLEAMEGQPPGETNLSNILAVLDQAITDNSVEALELDFSGLNQSGLAMIEPLREKLIQFRNAGKPIFAYADYMTQEQFYLYSTATDLYLDPLFFLEPLGFSSSRLYLQGALEEWGITPNIYKSGEYKSYTDVYSERSLSDQAREELKRWIDELWSQYQEGIAENLALPKEELSLWIKESPELLNQARGDWAELFITRGWAKKRITFEQFQQFLNEHPDFYREDGFSKTFSQYQVYKSVHIRQPSIALLPLSGEILYGEGDWGKIGSSSVLRTLENIDQNPQIRGLILWLDTPGGSVSGSEEIRRKIAKMSETMPVAVVTAGVNASGGYWITTAADRHFGQSSSITGSIGVFSYYFSGEDFLRNKLHIQEDGYSTTEQSRGFSLTQSPSEAFSKIQQKEVEFIYQYFLNLVSEGRDIPMETLESLAEGRVWTGVEAITNGLMDQIGGVKEAELWVSETAQIKDSGLALYHEDYRYSQSPFSAFRLHIKKAVQEELKSLGISLNGTREHYSY